MQKLYDTFRNFTYYIEMTVNIFSYVEFWIAGKRQFFRFLILRFNFNF